MHKYDYDGKKRHVSNAPGRRIHAALPRAGLQQQSAAGRHQALNSITHTLLKLATQMP